MSVICWVMTVIFGWTGTDEYFRGDEPNRGLTMLVICAVFCMLGIIAEYAESRH